MNVEQLLTLRPILIQRLPTMPDIAKPFAKNLIKQLRNLPGYVRHASATHKTQPLQGKINWQIDQLEAALQGR